MYFYRRGKIYFKGDEAMSKKQSIEAKMQSEIDNMKDARNSTSGFKSTMSSGTQGAGDALSRNKR